MYDVTTGRWTQTDPEQYVDGSNTYLMERGNPLDNLDPFGTAAENQKDEKFVVHDPDDPTSNMGSASVELTGSDLCGPGKNGKIHLRVNVHSNYGISGKPSDTGWLVINGNRVDVSPSDPGSTSDFNSSWSTDAGDSGNDNSGDITVVFVLSSKAGEEKTGGFMALKIHWSYTCKCGTPSAISKTVTRVDDNQNTNLPTTMPTTGPSTKPAGGE